MLSGLCHAIQHTVFVIPAIILALPPGALNVSNKGDEQCKTDGAIIHYYVFLFENCCLIAV